MKGDTMGNWTCEDEEQAEQEMADYVVKSNEFERSKCSKCQELSSKKTSLYNERVQCYMRLQVCNYCGHYMDNEGHCHRLVGNKVLKKLQWDEGFIQEEHPEVLQFI
jgi:hypothetical protein